MAQEKDPREVAGLIDKLLDSKDPATVGLRRILRQKRSEADDFPLTAMAAEDFSKQSRGDSTARVFTDDEKRVIELEREVLRLKSEMEDVRKKSDEGINNAWRKGSTEGNAAGLKEGEKRAKATYDAKLDDVFSRFAIYLDELESSRRALYGTVYNDALAVARAVARRILNAEITADADIAARTVRTALSYIADKNRLRIRVNPTDLPGLVNRPDLWPSVSDRLENVALEPDERITRGGCIVESAGGIADARIETQVAAIDELIDRLWADVSSAPAFPPEAAVSLAAAHFPEVAELAGRPALAAPSPFDEAFVEDAPPEAV